MSETIVSECHGHFEGKADCKYTCKRSLQSARRTSANLAPSSYSLFCIALSRRWVISILLYLSCMSNKIQFERLQENCLHELHVTCYDRETVFLVYVFNDHRY